MHITLFGTPYFDGTKIKKVASAPIELNYYYYYFNIFFYNKYFYNLPFNMLL